jgi:hypothetical protein
MRTPIVPQPYPGCRPCSLLLRDWVALTEPASPAYDCDAADRLAAEMDRHRRQDEEQAPAL